SPVRPQVDRARQGAADEAPEPRRARRFPSLAKAGQQQKQEAHRDRRDGADDGRGVEWLTGADAPGAGPAATRRMQIDPSLRRAPCLERSSIISTTRFARG